MNEQDDSMIESGSDVMTQDDGHICTDADMCTADQPQEHLIVSEPSLPVAPVTTKKKMRTHHIVLGVIGVLVIVVGALSAFVYTHASTDKMVQGLAMRLPFPAILVGRSVVTYKQFYNEQDSLKKYFASSVTAGSPAPTDEQLRVMIIQTLSNKAIIKTLASNYGLTLDQNKVEAFYQNFLQSNGGQAPDVIEQKIKETFGWTIPEFKQHVVEPIVLSAQVSDYIAASTYFQKPLNDEMRSAYVRVTTGGEDFEKVGTEVHDRIKVDMKSDLGFIKKSDLPESWGSKVADLENGKVTDVIELPQGYAIFKVTDRIKSQEVKGKKADPNAAPADEQLHLYTITVPKKTLDQVVAEYLANVSVKTLINM